jgi:predicted enzyme related to lactoylglutathione lyase
MLNHLAVGDEYQNGLPSLAPSQRLHLILLGVADVSRSADFYDALGWQRAPSSHSGFVKYDLGGLALCLISKKDLAADALSNTDQSSGFSGTALVYLAKKVEEVPQILTKAVDAGGTLVKPATKTHWGVAGYFRDPDGYLFEVDYEDAWVFDDEHHLIV